MGIQLSHEEIRDFLSLAHTGIFTSLRADGWPVSLPIWFVAIDDKIYVRSPSKTRKVARVKNDDRVSFTVESGQAWKELKAVVVTGRAVLVEDTEERARVDEALATKYESFGMPRAALPKATKRHYGGGSAVIRIDPVQPPLTWDNAKIRMRPRPAS